MYIADYLALVGDSADGYPGLAGCGAKTAAQLINLYGAIEDFPPEILKDDNRARALLFKNLATLRIDAPLFDNVDELSWSGATSSFGSLAEKFGDARLAKRVSELESRLTKKKAAK
jgi:5'-3' exonuclease